MPAPYVDLQVNGFMGIDFNDPQLPRERIAAAAEVLRQAGVEAALATVITGPLDAMCDCLRNLATAIDEDEQIAATLAGLHIEGPFISRQTGYVGAHPPECVLEDDMSALRRLLDAAGRHVKLVTLAPEADPHCRLIGCLADSGVLVAAGHTNASIEQLERAIDAGLQMFTHIGNACPLQTHRHDNILQRAMSLTHRLRTTFIADGWHLPAFVVKNLMSCAGIENLAVVSDAIAAAGLGAGEFQLGNRRVRVGDDKCARSPDGQHFIGAAATMADADQWLASAVGLSEEQRRRLLYENPKRWLELGSGSESS